MRAASVYPARGGVPDTELRCRFRQKREVRQYKEFFVNIKDLICSSVIVCSCGIYNAIMVASEYIFYTNNKPYKIKSDNIR